MRGHYHRVEEKTFWFLAHPDFLAGKLDLKKTAAAMKADGLIAKSSYWRDCRSGIEEAARRAKKQEVEMPMAPKKQ